MSDSSSGVLGLGGWVGSGFARQRSLGMFLSQGFLSLLLSFLSAGCFSSTADVHT